MLSSKFASGFGGLNPQAELLATLAREDRPVLDLTVSNPTTVGLPYPEDFPSLLANTAALRYTPSAPGDPDARKAIADYYRECGREVNPDDLFLTASTSEAYSFLFKLLCDPGDEILIPLPTYPLFDALAELENVKLLRYPLRMIRDDSHCGPADSGLTRWRPDMEFLRRLISTRSKALILVNPNNPTGNLADAGEIQSYVDFAAEHGLALIVDEVFSDYILGEKPFLAVRAAPETGANPLIFTLNGFSKLLGLPQLKLGWIHVAGEASLANRAKEGLGWIADAFLSVNTPVQIACGDLLDLRPVIQTAIKERLQTNLSMVDSLTGVSKETLHVLRPEAGWSLILDLNVPESDEAFALALLKEQAMNVHPGHLFGFEDGCRLVVSLLTEPDIFKEGIRRITQFLEEQR